jgi:hypothetical protein
VSHGSPHSSPFRHNRPAGKRACGQAGKRRFALAAISRNDKSPNESRLEHGRGKKQSLVGSRYLPALNLRGYTSRHHDHRNDFGSFSMAVRKPSRTPVKRSTRGRTDGSREGELSGKAGSASQRMRKRRAAAEAPEETSVVNEVQDTGVLPAAEEVLPLGASAAPLDASEAVESQTIEVSTDIPSATAEDPMPATGQSTPGAPPAEPAPAAGAKPPFVKRRTPRGCTPLSASDEAWSGERLSCAWRDG